MNLRFDCTSCGAKFDAIVIKLPDGSDPSDFEPIAEENEIELFYYCIFCSSAEEPS